MANPNPKYKFKYLYDEPLAKQIVGTRLPKSLDVFVRSLPNKSEWLRNAIAAQYERDMAAKGGSDSDSESDT